MPVYICTTTQSTLDANTKAALAADITRIHSRINGVPSTYVNVVFHELAPDDIYTDAAPGRPLIINGWTRTGHPEALTSQLVSEIAGAATDVTGIDADRVLVIIQNSPARFAMEGGRTLPEPGQEKAWIQARGTAT
ncbi:MAG: tautomerase family protein [Mycobacterium sp.]